MSREVMQQALDALILVRDLGVTHTPLDQEHWDCVFNAIMPLFELIEHGEAIAQPVKPAVLTALQAVSDAMCDPKDGDDLLDQLENLRPIIEDALSAIAQPVQPADHIANAGKMVLAEYESAYWIKQYTETRQAELELRQENKELRNSIFKLTGAEK